MRTYALLAPLLLSVAATTFAVEGPPTAPRPGPMKTEPTALAAGVESDVTPLIRPEASAYGLREKTFSSAHPRPVSVTDGEDWSLPPDVRPTPGYGIGWVDGRWIAKWSRLFPLPQADPDTIHFNQWIEVRWADVNPAPGVFDWSSVDEQIERIEDTPHLGFAFWLKAYGEFLRAVAQRYADHPRFCWVECRFIDRAWGEGSWCVEYDTEATRRRSPVVAVGTGDGWRTAVLELPGMVCTGGLADQMDFRPLHLDGADTVVRMARLVKWPEGM